MTKSRFARRFLRVILLLFLLTGMPYLLFGALPSFLVLPIAFYLILAVHYLTDKGEKPRKRQKLAEMQLGNIPFLVLLFIILELLLTGMAVMLTEGRSIWQFRSIEFPFSDPTYVAADSEGSVYVLLSTFGRIQKYDANGKLQNGFWANVSGKGGGVLFVDVYDNVYYRKDGNIEIRNKEGKIVFSEDILGRDGKWQNWRIDKKGDLVEDASAETPMLSYVQRTLQPGDVLPLMGSSLERLAFQSADGSYYRIVNLYGLFPSIRVEKESFEDIRYIHPNPISLLLAFPSKGLFLTVFMLFILHVILQKISPGNMSDLR